MKKRLQAALEDKDFSELEKSKIFNKNPFFQKYLDDKIFNNA